MMIKSEIFIRFWVFDDPFVRTGADKHLRLLCNREKSDSVNFEYPIDFTHNNSWLWQFCSMQKDNVTMKINYMTRTYTY
jgi:hypothetical protein